MPWLKPPTSQRRPGKRMIQEVDWFIRDSRSSIQVSRDLKKKQEADSEAENKRDPNYVDMKKRKTRIHTRGAPSTRQSERVGRPRERSVHFNPTPKRVRKRKEISTNRDGPVKARPVKTKLNVHRGVHVLGTRTPKVIEMPRKNRADGRSDNEIATAHFIDQMKGKDLVAISSRMTVNLLNQSNEQRAIYVKNLSALKKYVKTVAKGGESDRGDVYGNACRDWNFQRINGAAKGDKDTEENIYHRSYKNRSHKTTTSTPKQVSNLLQMVGTEQQMRSIILQRVRDKSGSVMLKYLQSFLFHAQWGHKDGQNRNRVTMLTNVIGKSYLLVYNSATGYVERLVLHKPGQSLCFRQGCVFHSGDAKLDESLRVQPYFTMRVFNELDIGEIEDETKDGRFRDQLDGHFKARNKQAYAKRQKMNTRRC